MDTPPPKTTFVSRGKLNGVLRKSPLGRRQTTRDREPPANGSAALDTNEYEARYYRAQLVLGDSLPRPPR